MRRKDVSYAKFGYIFTFPFVLAFLIFSLYPILYTAVIGFTDMKGLIPKPIHILDNPFQNFKDLLFDNVSFRKSLINTFLLWITNFIPQMALALLLTAWFTNKRLNVKGQGLFKVLLYMPNIITASTIAVLFSTLFAYPMGPVNSLFQMLGWSDSPIFFLQDKTTARGIIAFIQFWMWYGNTMIVLIAGVMGINPALFESAAIDGANGFQTFFRITLPSLRTILLFTLITSMVGGLTMFDIPQLFLAGGPDDSTLTTSMFIYGQAFKGSYMYNRAAAASMIMFLISAVLSGLLFYVMRDRDAAKLKKIQKQTHRNAAQAAAREV
ncbi:MULTISPECIES: sugar ABC transporter permease [Paenibacillus]|uniref:Multiple sugar transport system permease protein n=1 Tax=Paenibacillus silagei TaxID=1670801 RepID=A0ABS4NVZ8_9BACL|nr:MULTISPECIES: sugar ABC transporter permease [Paenibacillus]ETT62600.1 binding-protein-dependent transport system inner membrane protein [Paenibacillus sp. FSL R7-277]MBP2114233.1 multiple sugar transport system permease protein [Paenibacillus silagei]OMF89566.1 ABC transporter permease [Paenibacillus sp. FSL R7-0333]